MHHPTMCQCRRSDWCCFAAGLCIFLIPSGENGKLSCGTLQLPPLVCTSDTGTEVLTLSSLLSSPQGTGPQRHLRHNRRYQWSLYRPGKPEQAVSIPGLELCKPALLCACVGLGLSLFVQPPSPWNKTKINRKSEL